MDEHQNLDHTQWECLYTWCCLSLPGYYPVFVAIGLANSCRAPEYRTTRFKREKGETQERKTVIYPSDQVQN